jgi:hypothetical protein
MTDKQTIDGVPRDFLELSLRLCHLLGIQPDGHKATVIRALLDAPADPASALNRAWQAGYDTGFYAKNPAHERPPTHQKGDSGLVGIIANEMNRLGYGLHESHAASILCALQTAQAPANNCKSCSGTRLVSDGALQCSAGGIPYENGPIELVKDCPDCQPATQPQADPVAFTAVGVLRDDGDGGLVPEWILEGGTSELWAGAMLLIADEDQELCAEDGHCELYRAQPAPVAAVLPDRDTLRDIIAQAIGGDTYDCTRVWNAWSVGTMSDDDFVPVVDQEARLYEITDACLEEFTRINA